MTLEATRPFSPPAPRVPAEIGAAAIRIQVVDATDTQEATMRQVVTPRVEIDHDDRHVTLISQGLSLREERRTVGERAVMIEVAARYRRGEGAIKQSYRYLVFANAEEREGAGAIYAVRLPMGAWTPGDPDVCLAWLGRGGLQQGDFVLLPRKAVPAGAAEISPPPARSFWQSAAANMKRIWQDAVGEAEAEVDEWTRLIGRHDPRGMRLFKKEERLYLLAGSDTVVLHPEHAPLAVPAGAYEVAEDRATRYWRKAID